MGEAQENYMMTVSSKVEMEKHYEEFLAKKAHELQEKTNEFEQLRDKFIPQDIDYIRVKVQEELEIPHKIKIQSMEEEVEKHKDMYYTIRRELDRSKAEFDAYSQLQAKEMESLKDEHNSVVDGLKRDIQELSSKQYAPEKDETIRSLKLNVNELEYAVEAAKQAALTARKEKDAAIFEKDQFISRNENEVLQLRIQNASITSELVGFEQKLATLGAELDKKENSLKTTRVSLQETEEQLEKTKTELENRTNEFVFFKDNYIEEKATLKSELELSKSEFDNRSIEYVTKIHEREELLRKAHRDMAEQQARYEAAEREYHRNTMVQLRDLQSRNQMLELDLADANVHAKAEESKSMQAASANAKNMDFVKSEKARPQREKDILHEKLRNYETKYDEVDTKLKRSEKEWMKKVKDAEDTSKNFKERMLEMQLNVEKLTSHNSELNANLLTATRKCDYYANQLESFQKEANNKYEQLGNTYKEQLSTVKNKLKKSLEKEKKKAEAYKEKAIMVHEKNKALLSGAKGGKTVEIY